MSKNSFIMTSLAKRAGVIALSATLSVAAFAGTAYAYFTSHTQAAGSHPIELGYSSEVVEDIVDGNKNISMVNTGDTEIMVRVQLFYGTGVNNNVKVTVPGAATTSVSGWSQGDNGVWNYAHALQPGESTNSLWVDVEAAKGTDLSNFDVTVIGQTSPIYYDEDGNPVPYLWSSTAQSTPSIEGADIEVQD